MGYMGYINFLLIPVTPGFWPGTTGSSQTLYSHNPVLTPLKLCFDPVKTLYVPQNVAQMYHNYKSFSKNSKNSKNGKNSKLTTSCN